MVEARVANPRMQTLLLALTVFGLLVVGMTYDYVSSRSNHETARVELEKQRAINLQMLAVNKEQADLEKKAQEIQSRIDAIKRLRLLIACPWFSKNGCSSLVMPRASMTNIFRCSSDCSQRKMQ